MRKVRHTSSTRRDVFWASIVLGVMCSAVLACANGQMKPGVTLESINNGEVFDDLFSNKTNSTASTSASQVNDGFFTAPKGWEIVSIDDDNGVYKLKHKEITQASIVLSYDALKKQGDQRVQELEVLHHNVISRLPSSLVRMQSEMTRQNGEPKFHTMLRGKPSESSPEMIVSGYTISLEQDAFTVFAAYPVESRTLASDIEALMYSLKPYKPLDVEPEAKEEESDTSKS